jgi:ferritin-like metal-binding protein YciE
MKKSSNAFYLFFVDLLKDILSAENQIIEALPKVIKTVHNGELKKTLSNHLEETKIHVQCLKKIFKDMNESPLPHQSKGIKGLLNECTEEISKKYHLLVEDAALIIACQKIEHYEIASYGSARSIARLLSNVNFSDRIDFDEIASLLQESLDEEHTADHKLTSIAEGGFFTTGINDDAEFQEEQATIMTKKKK